MRTRIPIAPRPSQKSGRTHLTVVAENQSTSQTLHTPTPGKAAYITSLTVTAYNSSGSNPGRMVLRNGVGGTIRVPYLMAPAGLSGLATNVPLQANPLAFVEPLQFTDAIRLDIISGSVTYSVALIGYEE